MLVAYNPLYTLVIEHSYGKRPIETDGLFDDCYL